jgi:hypothetical protein
MDEDKENTLAILSMVFAFISLFMTPIMLSALAMILGKIQLNNIRDHPDIYGGEQFAKIGFWVGLVNLAFRGFSMIIGIFLAIFMLIILMLFPLLIVGLS